MPSSSRLGATLLAAAIALAQCAKGGGGGSAASNASASPAPAPASVAASSAPVALAEKHFPSQGHDHVTTEQANRFHYNSDPPTSGPHLEIFNDVFVSQVPLAKYLQVHLLEHGNVLLQYDCVCPDVAAALAKIAGEYDTRLLPPGQLQPTTADVQGAEEQGLAVIVAPYAPMKSRIALTAWTRLATMEQVERQQVAGFINKYLHNAANAGQ